MVVDGELLLLLLINPSTAMVSTARLCARRKQGPGKQGRCQKHHRSSCSHDFSLRRAEPPSDMVARLRVSLGHGTVDDARYDIISLPGRRVTLVKI
jgi:hypothetical protein